MKELLLNNIGTKISAILLALLTWYAVREVTSVNETIEGVVLEIKHPEGWAISSLSEDRFNVTFAGSKEDILKLDKDRIKLELNLEGTKFEQEQQVTLEAKHVLYSGAARVISVIPSDIVLKLGREVSREVTVKPNWVGKLSEGYIIDSYEITPASVKVYGSRSQLENLKMVGTEDIDVTGKEGPFEIRATISIENKDWIDRVEPNKVMLKAQLSNHDMTRIFQVVPVSVILSASQKEFPTLEPESVSIKVKGAEALLRSLSPEDIHCYVDASTLDPRVFYELPVHAKVPELIEVLEVFPSSVKAKR